MKVEITVRIVTGLSGVIYILPELPSSTRVCPGEMDAMEAHQVAPMRPLDSLHMQEVVTGITIYDPRSRTGYQFPQGEFYRLTQVEFHLGNAERTFVFELVPR